MYDTEYDQNVIFGIRFYSKMTKMVLRRYNSIKNIVYSLFLLKVNSKNAILEKLKKQKFEKNVKRRL